MLADVLQPILEELKREIIARNETQVVDVHVFTLDDGEDSDNRRDEPDFEHDNLRENGTHHEHHHVQHQPENEDSIENEVFDEVEEIIVEERKLSRKFSGIADMLERKMEAG